MTKKVVLAALLGSWLAAPAMAQQSQQAAPTTAEFVRTRYMINKMEVTRSAEKMPEEFYGLRPGQQDEVRTFGQHVAHIANFNYLWCSEARGVTNPNAGINLEKTLETKAEFLDALRDSFEFCDVAFEALTDQTGAEVIDITSEGGRRTRMTRMALLIMDLAHNNATYGSIATTLRIKNIVPGLSGPPPQ